MLANRLDAVPPSPTFAVMALAGKLKSEGKDIISLAPGEPDFETPDHIKEEAIRAIKEGQTRYTAVGGTQELKEAVLEKFQNENHLTYSPEEVIVGTGAKQMLYNAFTATVNPGDEILIPAPYWVSYPDMATLSGGLPIIIECSQSDGFKLTPDKLKPRLNENTRWLILNSPSNPSGAVYSKNELIALAEILSDYPRVWIMSDDIYEHLIYSDAENPFSTFAQLGPEYQARTLTINGVSKAYCMTGWRIGYAGGPKSLIKAMNIVQSQSTSCPSAIGQAAALAALKGEDKFIQKNNETYRKRRDLMVGLLNQIPGFKCDLPEGAFYAFPSCNEIFGKETPEGKVIRSDAELATFLIEHAGVAAVPGSAFGSPGHIRFSYATDLASIKDGCNRIRKSCQSLKYH
ncbi:MAG: pyridoxal phosphate-dependent aminotransferase [Desulfobacterales bacterium]|nr:pyridoxal phosphate-dependent aminotransferase [Desulfobacterales bacterium]